ncbi:MAG TPA: TIGR03435 family protein [Bryobacteraceae bacterium]|nr:TIGR03435 family protein [Bryobacteraceae bacterium]
MHAFVRASVYLCMVRPIACLVISVTGALAQPAAAPKRFDVASIKPNSDNDNRFMLRYPTGGTFRATGVTLKTLLMQAYDVQAFQVSNAPGWVGRSGGISKPRRKT